MIQVLDSNAPHNKEGDGSRLGSRADRGRLGGGGLRASATLQPRGRMPGFDAGYSIPRGLRRKEKKLGPDDLVKWGDATMPKYPMAPRGMQFVNIEGLVDVSDL